MVRTGIFLVSLILLASPVSSKSNENTAGPELEKAIGMYRKEGAEAALPEFERLRGRYLENGNRVSETHAERYVGECHWRLGNYDRSRTHLDQALMLSRSLGLPAVEGRVLNVLGLLEWDLGNYDRAIERFLAASRIGDELGDRRLAGSTMNNLSLVYDELGDYDTSLKQYEKALQLYEGADFPRGESDTLGNIGGVYLLLGRYREALPYYQRALEISERLESSASMSLDHGNLALCYLGLGQLDRATGHANTALELARVSGMQKEEALWLRSLGNIRIRQGRYDLGLENHREALAIYERIEARGMLLDALHDMGRLHLLLGDQLTARSYFERGIELATELRASQALTVNQLALGDLWFHQDNLSGAESLYRQAFERANAAGEMNFRADSLLRLSLVHRELGRLVEARAEAVQALEIARTAEAARPLAEARLALADLARLEGKVARALETYASALESASAIGDPELLWQIHYGRARTRILENEPEMAVSDLMAAVGVIESVRSRLREDRFRAGYVQDKYEVYVTLVRLQLELGRTQQAFESAERLRARSFLERFERPVVMPGQGLDPGEEFALRERIRQLQDALVEEQNTPYSERRNLAVGTFSRELREAERQYQALLDDHYSRSIVGRAAHVPGATELQARLEPGRALIEYVVDHDRVMVFVMTADSLRSVSGTIESANLHAKVNLLRELTRNSSSSLWRRPARSLADALIAPLEQDGLLDGIHHLYLVPHGILNYLPFALLPTAGRDGQQVVIDKYALSYLPAAAALFHGRAEKPANSPMLALAPERTRLKYSEQEARSVAASFRPDARLLLGERATETAFKDLAGQFGVLHLSTHGYFNPHNPLLSGLELEADGQNDGYLEVHEILGLSLDANLVTLSACETGLGSGHFGQVPVGDDFVSLTRAFLLAGSRSVMATLWEVDDRSTVEVMQEFYAFLAAGESSDDPAVSLARVQRGLRASSRYSHPFYWAAFILVGHQMQPESARILARRG